MILSVHAFPDKLSIVTSSVKSDPPNLGLSSAKITFAPFFAAAYALDNPAGPDPVTNKSQYSYLCSYLSLSFSFDATPKPAAFLIKGSYILYQKLFGHINVL